MGKVRLVGRDGRQYEFDREDAGKALAQGYRTLTDAEIEVKARDEAFSGVGAQLAAGYFGAARGATAGLSDVALTRIFEAEPELLSAAKKHAAGASVAGEVAGSVLGVLAGPSVPAGAIAKGSQLAGKAAGKLLGKAATEGAEAAAGAAAREGAEAAGTAIARRGAQAVGLADEAAAAAAPAAQELAAQGVTPKLLTAGAAELAEAGAREVGEAGVAAAVSPIKELVGKVAKKAVVSEAAKRKLVESTVEGAVEGMAYGGGQTLSEWALGDADLTAQRIVGNIGFGALLGGATGGVMQFGSLATQAAGRKAAGAAKSILKKSGATSARQFLEDIASESAVKATGARGSQLQRLGDKEKIRDVGKILNDYHLDDGRKLLGPKDDPGDFLEKLVVAEREAGQRLGKYKRQIDAYVKANPSEAWDTKEFLQRVKTEVLDDLVTSGVANDRRLAKRVVKELNLLGKHARAGKQLTPKQWDRFHKGIKRIVYPPKPKGGGLVQMPPHADVMFQVERLLSDFISEGTDRAAAKVFREAEAQSFGELKKVYEAVRKGRDLAHKADLMDYSNRVLSLTDMMTAIGGGAAFGGPTGMLTGAAMGLAHKYFRERGRAMTAYAASKLGKLAALERASMATESRMMKAVEAAFTGDGKTPAGATLSAMPMLYRPIAERGGTEREAAKRTRDAGKKDYRKQYHQRVRELRDVAADPGAVAAKVAESTAGVSDVAPNVTAAMTATASRAASFLLSKVPEAVVPPVGLDAVQKQYEPSDSEIARFARYHQAVRDPMSVLEDLAAGRGTMEGVEALKVVYPRVYERVYEQAFRTMTADSAQRPSYRQRLNASLLLGTPLDATMTPQYVQTMQAQYGPQESEPRQPPMGTGGALAAHAGRMKTKAQKLSEA